MDFYVKLRNDESRPKDSITIDHRQFEGLIRISTAYAKFHFRSVVDIECVDKAIELYEFSLKSFGMCVNDGKTTQSGIEDSYIKTATNDEKRKHAIYRIFRKLDNGDGLVVREDLRNEIKASGLFEEEYKMDNLIKKIEQSGELSISGNCYKWSG